MNRRIKKKVVKRIINKIGTKQSLTFFERKYIIKFFWKPIRKEIIRIGEQLKAEAELQTQSILKHMYKLEDAEEMAVEQAEWMSNVDYAEGTDLTATSVVEINMMTKEEHNEIIPYKPSNEFLSEPKEPVFYEPSKWNKLRGKVKGWFGK